MLNIPFIDKHTTVDQGFYDAQVNEELKYCSSSNFAIRFVGIGNKRRAFVIRTRGEKTIVLLFSKTDYRGINKVLKKLRVNLALAKKESELGTIDTTSRNTTSIKGDDGQNNILTISTLDQLLINKQPLKETEPTVKRLLDLSMQNDREEPYLDFCKAGYDAGIQNYLILSLYGENIRLNERLVNAIAFYKAKEPRIYYLVNSFLRGNFDDMMSYLKTLKGPISVCSIARMCQNIIQAQEELPKRSCNIMIYRAGFGVNKNKTVGAQNTYDSFVSFGTSGGTLAEQASDDSTPVLYKRILKKDEDAIPVDLIENLGTLYLDGSLENEFLLPPFTFRITEVSKEEATDVYDIEEIEKINPRALLGKRLGEMAEYLKSKGYMEEYTSLVQSYEEILKRAPNTNSEPCSIDIYYGLRPEKKRTKKLPDTYGNR